MRWKRAKKLSLEEELEVEKRRAAALFEELEKTNPEAAAAIACRLTRCCAR